MGDDKPITEWCLNVSTAKNQASRTLRLDFRDRGSGKVKTLEVIPLTSPSELPDPMKAPESQSQEHTVA